MSGPVPSRLVFLSDLPDIPDGEKVRFLGCVEEYDSLNGRLIVRHDYPHTSSNITIACVDIEHLLESINSLDMSKGAWVNLVGYKTPPSRLDLGTVQNSTQTERHVYLQAVMIWSAGALKLKEYEEALISRLQSGK
ncbi:hypothetical protein EV356DRAFT_508334 [Viridothelium virens]|uniref:CST complex subunit Ten1 n=1 Tax=Viridothelium virens TaxID=1048519 RepID=A0A6A6GZF7_VIRVR|nr:hypothetical protein EV356DRAFT_508334 [Viridothelium virens]